MNDAMLFPEAADAEVMPAESAPRVPMVREETALTSDGFIATVLSQPDGESKIALLRELIAMRNEERARMAKEDFDDHFAAMQRALHPVVKRKLNGGTSSYYAPIEDLQDQCDPVIFEHGFSYSWREEAIDESRKRIIMDICGYGHTRSIPWEAPIISGNRATNALQNAGIQSTYGQRYTYKSGFGIVTKGEDTDGHVVDIDDELQKDLSNIGGAKLMESLLNFYRSSYEKYKANPEKLRLVIGEYNIRRKELEKDGAK